MVDNRAARAVEDGQSMSRARSASLSFLDVSFMALRLSVATIQPFLENLSFTLFRIKILSDLFLKNIYTLYFTNFLLFYKDFN